MASPKTKAAGKTTGKAAASAASPPSVRRETDPVAEQEFGGAVGAVGLIIFSHVLPYYLWISNFYYQGTVIHPTSFDDALPWLQRMWGHITADALPNYRTATIYFGFLLFEALMAQFLPIGPKVKGLPIKSEGGRRLDYQCNALAAWYIALLTVAGLHLSGIFKITEIFDNFGSLMTVAIISGDVISILIYLSAFIFGKAIRVSGNPIYDFFMGIFLNPRIGRVDIKMWAEIRVSWTILFFLTVSAAVKQYETYGVVTAPMWFMILAHGLYTNACQKVWEPSLHSLLHSSILHYSIFSFFFSLSILSYYCAYYFFSNSHLAFLSFLRVKNASQLLGTSVTNVSVGCFVTGILQGSLLSTVSNPSSSIIEVQTSLLVQSTLPFSS